MSEGQVLKTMDKILNPLSMRYIDIDSDMGKLIEIIKKKEKKEKGVELYDPIKKKYINGKSKRGQNINELYRLKKEGKMEKLERKEQKRTAVTKIKSNIINQYEKQKFKARDHQDKLSKFFTKTRKRGVLYDHGLGSGKTSAAILSAVKYVKKNNVDSVWIFTTGSLRQNFIGEFLTKFDDKDLFNRFKFVTYNRNDIRSALKKDNLDNSLIIIDEAHNIIRSKKNQSEQYSAVYDKVNEAKNIKILLLTGTPLTSDREELFLIIDLLDPGIITRDEFYEIVNNIDKESNKSKIKQIIAPIVSHMASMEKGTYPDMKIEHINVKMTEEQYEQYKKIRKEEVGIKPNGIEKYASINIWKKAKARYYLSITRLRSRQKCNMMYPKQDILDEDIPDDLEDESGWITARHISNIGSFSPKIEKALDIVKKTKGKIVIYSQFKTRYGVYFLDALFYSLGYNPLLFTGDLNDTERKYILDDFNSKENLYGENHKILLITDAGSLGINVIAARALIIMEQNLNETLMQQTIGRTRRFESHKMLPKKEQNVTVYRLFATSPAGEETSDHEMFNRGCLKLEKLKPLLEIFNSLPIVPTL